MHRGMCLPIPAQGKISINTSDFRACFNLPNTNTEQKCWRDRLQFRKDCPSFLKSQEYTWKTINGRARGKQLCGAPAVQKDGKNSFWVCQLWVQLGDYLTRTALPHSCHYSLGTAMRRNTLGVIGNHFTCFLQPALFIFYFIFLSPGLHMPWEGISGVGFHWDPTCACCSTSLPGRL